MARIILNWLNEEVRLSKEITSLSEDFSTGYLLGELLAAYNQQQEFHRFINKDSPDAKIRNYCLLQPTMRQVGVHFNSKVAFDLIHHKPGAMKTLLYELKTVLDNVKEMSMNPDGQQKCVIMQIIRPSLPLYDKTMSSTFENAIRSMVENSNDVLYKKTQTSYDNMSVSFKESVSMSHSLQLDDIAIEIQRNKELTRQRRRHEKDFQETWHEINMDQWRTNQVVARDRRNLQTIVDNRITSRKNLMKKQENVNAREKAISSIDEFEERLSTMRIKEDSGDKTLSIDVRAAGGEEGTGIPKLSYMNEDTLRDGMIKNQKIMQERNEKLRIRRQEHDKRRKRFVRMRESHHSSILHSDADKEIVEQVLITSQIEDVEQFAKLRFMAYGNMIMQNDKNLHCITELQTATTIQDIEKCKTQETVLEKQCVIQHHLAAQACRLLTAEEARTSAYRIETEETATRELTRILDITDWIVNMRALGVYEGGLEVPQEDVLASEEKILPELLLKDVCTMFTAEEIDIPDALPVMHPTNVFQDLPCSLSWKPLATDSDWLFEDAFHPGKFMKNITSETENDESDMATYLNKVDAQSFIQQISDFKAPVMNESDTTGGGGKKDIKKKDSKKDKEGKGKNGKKNGKEEETTTESGIKIITPTWIGQIPSDCLLGETIVRVRCLSTPISEPPSVPATIPAQQIRIVLCGSSITMKSKVALALSNELELKILKVGELLSVAMTVASEQKEEEKEEPSTYSLISSRIFNNALDGQAVTDDDYVDLLVEAISKLEVNGKGFVIEDFPNTENQAFKLVTAMSGIDYNEHRNQPLDAVSKFLTTVHRDEMMFDVQQCGFDHMFFLSSAPLSIVHNRVTTRENYLINEIVSITDETTQVDTLAEVITPTNPMDTMSFLVANSTQAIEPIRKFATRLGIQCNVEVDDDKDVSSVVDKILHVIRPTTPPLADDIAEEKDSAGPDAGPDAGAGAGTDVEVDVEVEVVEETKPKEGKQPSSSSSSDAKETSSSSSTESSELLSTSPLVVYQEGELPLKLAKVLNQMWSTGEQQVSATSVQFFAGLRAAQYQMIQRRGGLRNAVLRSLLRRDQKQELFDEFREQFNSFEMDFRFDVDLINELYLRTLELRHQFWSISEKRAEEANECIETISRDASVKVLIHNCECEGAQLLQMYANLFVSGLNLLFDHMRAVSSYDYQKTVAQSLEEVDPVSEDYLGPSKDENSGGEKGGKGGKDSKSSGGKDSKSGGRVAISCPILWSDMETTIPQATPKVEVEDPGNSKKKPAKEKKGDVDESAPSPFAMSREKASAFCSNWLLNEFSVDSEIYGEDEALAAAIEKAIGHEANRFKYVIEMVSTLVATHSQWLMDQEVEVVDLMKKLVEKRKITELATNERLCEMIYQCIEENVPIRTQWQVASDVIVVRQERLVYPPPYITETIEMNSFFMSKLNHEQIALATDMLKQLHVGNSIILKEDLCEWLVRCNSGIGPVACNISPIDTFNNLSFPVQWQSKLKELLSSVYCATPVTGTAEETGVMQLDEILNNLIQFGSPVPTPPDAAVALVTEVEKETVIEDESETVVTHPATEEFQSPAEKETEVITEPITDRAPLNEQTNGATDTQ